MGRFRSVDSVSGFATRHIMFWFTVFSIQPFLGCGVCLLIGAPKVVGFGMPCISGGPAWFRIQSDLDQPTILHECPSL